MKAVIMAGGRGTRLRPLTCYVPKPMVPLLDRPCMEYIIDLLKKHDVRDIAVTVQYMPQVIASHFRDGSDFGVNMQVFEEQVPLGTAGSVKNAEAFLDETFVVISGDGMTDFDLTEIVRFHKEKGSMATVVMTKVDVPLEYGVVMTEEDGKIIRFLEKPSWSEVFSDTVNTGIYVIEPEVLTLFEKDQEFDFSKDLFPLMLERGMPLYGYVAEGYWSDIGNLDQYRQTQFDMLMGLVDVEIRGTEQFPRVWVGADVSIEKGAMVHGPSFIGDGASIGADAQIGPYAVVGRETSLGARVVMERSATWSGNHIGSASTMMGATLCSNIQIGSGADICEGAVIGEKSRIGDQVVIRPGIKVWPEKTIGDGTIQSSSLIWGSTVFHSLFDENGITGRANVELIPEMVSRIASSYGSSIKKGAFVAVSCDEYPYCMVLKLSAMASLMAAGLQVRDIGVAPVPVARFEIRRSNNVGGLHIRSVEEDGERQIVLQFFDADGLPIDKGTERKIENAFMQEDFSRPDPRGIGRLEIISQVGERYISEVLEKVRTEVILARRYSVLLHCDSQPVRAIMQPILANFGCEVILLSTRDRAIGKAVVANGADLGISLDASGQKFEFYTETGELLSRDEVMILQMLIAVKEQSPVVVPVTAPSVIEEISEQVGARVVRTKTVLRSLLEVDRDNSLQVHFDGFYSVVSLIQFLAEEQMSLQSIINQLPQFHMKTEMVPCPVRAKGRVMRQLMEDIKGQQLELIDGIKVLTEEGWALIMPDAEKALFKIVAQGNTPSKVEELVNLYRGKITSYQHLA